MWLSARLLLPLLCVSLSVCVCVSERERERERSFEFEIFGWSAERYVERGVYNLRFSWASFLTNK